MYDKKSIAIAEATSEIKKIFAEALSKQVTICDNIHLLDQIEEKRTTETLNLAESWAYQNINPQINSLTDEMYNLQDRAVDLIKEIGESNE